MSFAKKKFLSFPLIKQHKKAAEELRFAYEKQKPLTLYRQLEKWLSLEPVSENAEALSNRFHYHLKCFLASFKEHNLLKNLKHFDTLSKAPYGTIDIYLDHVRSGHNIGSILRTVEAFRLGTVHFSPDMPGTENKKVQDGSMGTSSLVPTSRTPLNKLKKPLIALETMKGSTSLFNFTFPKVFTLMIGNEEYGLSKEALSLASSIIEIPLIGSKNSLNVACAFAIVAAQIMHQSVHEKENNLTL